MKTMRWGSFPTSGGLPSYTARLFSLLVGPDRERITRLRDVARPFTKHLAFLFAFSICLALLTAAYGALAGPLLRALFGGGDLTWPPSLIGILPPPPSVDTLRVAMPWLIIGVAAAKAVVQHVHSVSVVALGERVKSRLRLVLHQHVMGWSPDVIRSQGVSDLSSRSTHDVDQVSRFVTDGLIVAGRDGLQVVALVGLCVAIDWRLALVAFCVYPLAFWPVIALGKRLRGSAGVAQERHSELLSTMDDHYRRAELYQLSGAVEVSHARYQAKNDRLAAATIATERVKAIASPLMEVFGAAALAGGVVYTIARVDDASLAPELVMSFLAALLMLYQPAKKLARLQGVLEPARAAFERLLFLLECADRLPEGGQSAPPTRPECVTVDRVRCRRGGRSVLEDVDGEFHRGEITAVLGANGTGKTTLAWILGGLLSPDSGGVYVDGVPLLEMDLMAWRRSVGWVTQDSLLGRGTLRENVLLGGSVPQDVLDTAALHAGLTPVLERLPDGWDEVLGEHGAGLSGGEQQRVALCRALARSPTLLIMDEPSAHLDREAARALAQRLSAIKIGCAVVLITHDLELAQIADRTLSLEASGGPNRMAG